MRAARSSSIIVVDDKTVAINLGADFVSEHEWGIKSTYHAFGIKQADIGVNPVGVGSRTVTKMPSEHNYDALICQDFAEKPKTRKHKNQWSTDIGYTGTLLALIPSFMLDGEEDLTPNTLRDLSDRSIVNGDDEDLQPISAAWSDGDFAIFARKPEDIEFIKDLYTAIQNNDVAIWLGSMNDNPFSNSGLCLGIVSRMNDEILNTFRDSDVNAIKLSEASDATGIITRLKNANRGYYACSPKWATEIASTKNGKILTDYDVIYWLNPSQQDENNCGWFTVEQLDQWIDGEGPIPMTGKSE